jgi:hypothetical protein
MDDARTPRPRQQSGSEAPIGEIGGRAAITNGSHIDETAPVTRAHPEISASATKIPVYKTAGLVYKVIMRRVSYCDAV